MEANINKVDDKLTVKVSGRIDTTTSSQLETQVNAQVDDVKDIVFDFADLEYISSAGLRLLLHFQKLMNSVEGKMQIKNANEFVMEVFEMTGFKEILSIA